MSPGDCCTSDSWWVDSDCHHCPFGYADTVADLTNLCGVGSTFTWAFGHTWGQCKSAPRPPDGTGDLEEGSCCLASGLASLTGWGVCEECPWGYTNKLVDTNNACSAWNTIALAAFSTVGTCNYEPKEDAMNDVYLTSRMMQMAIATRHHVTNEAIVTWIDDTDPAQFMTDYIALRDFGYNLEDYEMGSDSFHVIQGERTALGEPGAHIIYFLAEHGGNTELVITFPGSATIYDWIETNMGVTIYGDNDLLPFVAGGETFMGAATAVDHYQSTRKQFLEEIEQLLNKQCVESCVDVIRVLGHSLGGSAAQFGAIDMAKKFAGRFKVWLSTFASIRALDSESSDRAHRLLSSNGNRAMRFMIEGDIVPWTGRGLKHIGEAYSMENGVLSHKDREYMPTDTLAVACCPLCAPTDDVLSGIATWPAAAVCLARFHVMKKYIQQADVIKGSNRHLLDNGRVPVREVTRRCSAFPPNCPPETPTENLVEENAAGGWGGSCTCPDGSVYQVGDNNDFCDSLACVGGVSGGCNRQHGVWSYRKVTCAARDSSAPKETGRVSRRPVIPLYEQWGYVHRAEACVSGANIVLHKDTSVDDCAQHCEQHPECVAFEYGVNHGGSGYEPRDCQLQSSAAYQGCDGARYNLDLYIKQNRRNLYDISTPSLTKETQRKL